MGKKNSSLNCPKCRTFMDKVTAWVCSKCGGKSKKVKK